MDPKNDEPFDREAWRRLLDADAGGPSELTDRRILAKARRAHRSRVARWYLPASLAASLLLAVFIVRWQLEDAGRPALVTESDVLPAQAPTVADKAMPSVKVVPQRREEPATPAKVAPPVLETPAPDLRSPASRAAPAAAPVPAPSQEMTVPERGQLAAKEATAARFGVLKESGAAPRNPEEWYAQIEELRAAGRTEEADAELARLEAAWPGWLARHHPQNR